MRGQDWSGLVSRKESCPLFRSAWSCPACNSHKSDKTYDRDPQTGRAVPLFNPRTQEWKRHFRWSEDGLLIVGRTATGRATERALHLNRRELVNLPLPAKKGASFLAGR